MFILIPTCDTHAAVASVSVALLDRYWPGHPPVHVLHDGLRPRIPGATLHDSGFRGRSPWLGRIATFLRQRQEELFVLLLDDYAACGPARQSIIDAGRRLLETDPSVGLFALGWYPGASRSPRAGWPGIVTLGPAPVLLQAAIWRREWFLELAGRMKPETSPWSFEAHATRLARSGGREICAADFPAPAYTGGHLADAFDKSEWPLPYHNLMHRGEPVESHEPFLDRHGLAFPSRGLGDAVARLARVTGAHRLADGYQKLTGRDCGCGRRRLALNRLAPPPVSRCSTAGAADFDCIGRCFPPISR